MKKTPPLWIIIAFLVVAVPLAWGLYRSVKNSKPLFTSGSAPAAAPAPAIATPVPTVAPTARPVVPIVLTPTPTPHVLISPQYQPAPTAVPGGPIPPDS